MREYKYKNYKELFEAFDSGELSRDDYVIMVDNDNITLSYRGSDREDMTEDEEDELYEKTSSLFRGNGYEDIEEILKAAGYPAEGV